ncbi:hypothetical protein FKM82_022639 [Ascaphus truei]
MPAVSISSINPLTSSTSLGASRRERSRKGVASLIRMVWWALRLHPTSISPVENTPLRSCSSSCSLFLHSSGRGESPKSNSNAGAMVVGELLASPVEAFSSEVTGYILPNVCRRSIVIGYGDIFCTYTQVRFGIFPGHSLTEVSTL